MEAQGSEPLVLCSTDGGVLTLTLNRPQARNALSEGLLAELQAGLDRAAQDPATRVVVIAANGPAFSAGHDLKEMTPHWNDSDAGRAYFAALLTQCAKVMQTIVRLPKPVIAQVHGIATAAGCQLVATCDLAIAAEGTRFATPGVNIGLFCSTPMVALSRNCGAQACDGDAADRGHDPCRTRGRDGADQPRGAARDPGRDRAQPRASHRIEVSGFDRHRQGSLLSPAGDGAW
jgi:hypothetical protein